MFRVFEQNLTTASTTISLMQKPPISDRKRRAWLIATAGLGLSGGVVATAALVRGLQPVADGEQINEASSVQVDISTLQPGEKRVVQWRGKPVWILRRTPVMLDALHKLNPAALIDPESRRNRLPTPAFARNAWRSRKPEIFVCFGLCSHLGCTPVDRFQAGAQAGLPADWPGGFVCPCHGSSFDLAGRVFKNQVAADNLEVPPYVFLSDTQLLIGAEDVTQATASHG